MAVQALGIGLDYYHSLPGTVYWASAETGFMTKSKILAAYRTIAQMDAIKRDLEFNS